MKICETCQVNYPDSANYCANCGNMLIQVDQEESFSGNKTGRWNLFWLTLIGSLAISFVLIAVFQLPVFILGAILPLFWLDKLKKK